MPCNHNKRGEKGGRGETRKRKEEEIHLKEEKNPNKGGEKEEEKRKLR